MAATTVLVRVQAKGGKFIGPDAGYSRVTVRDAATGAVLASGMADGGGSGGSGALADGFSSAAARGTIATQQWGMQTHVWVAVPETGATAGFTATLDLDAPTLVDVTAEGLAGGEPNGGAVTQTMWLVPGQDLTAEPGLVLVMPGLRVAVLSPVGAVSASGGGVDVTAQVRMMCGCPIDPEHPWLPEQFAVSATVRQVGGTFQAQVPLAWTASSTFGTAAPVQLPGGGDYVVAVTAVQAAEANVGHASSTFSVTV
jgi:hypothetical protein